MLRGKKNIALTFFLCVLVMSPLKSWGQYYSVGENPSNVKWKEMSSKNFKVIYPIKRAEFNPALKSESGYEKLIKNYLLLMEKNYGILSDSIEYNYGLGGLFPTIVHPFNAISNGVTFWSPRQIDYFMLPPTGLQYPQPWHQQLVLHEGRHAWQIAHFNKGFLKVLYWVFGEQVIGMASGVYPSSWMLEGDAVVAETQMSKFGRGRSGSFLAKTLNTIIPDGESGVRLTNVYGKNRNWDRWRFGSDKYYSPSQYHVGYMINAMARYKTKDYNLTHKILSQEPMQLYNVNTVANAFKDFSGRTHRDYTKDSLLQEYYSLNTNKEIDKLLKGVDNKSVNITGKSYKRGGGNKNYYLEYYNIVDLSEDSLVAVASGYGSMPYLVLYKRNGDSWDSEILRYMPQMQSGISTYNARKIFWSEPVVDARWEQVARNKIFSYDIPTKKLENIDVGNDYLYSPMNCKNILYAISYDPELLESKIVAIKDLKNDKIIYSEPNSVVYSTNNQITEICSINGEIFFTEISDNGVSLKSVKGRTIIKDSKAVIKEIIGGDKRLFFISDIFGEDLLLSVDPTKEGATIANGDISIASSSRGITMYTVLEDKGLLYVTKHLRDRGVYLFKEEIQSIPATEKLKFNFPLAEELSRQYVNSEEYKAMSSISDEEVPVSIKKYKKFSNLFKFHSWAPFYTNYTGATNGSYDDFFTEIKPGVTLFSQNELGTMSGQLGYSYNSDERLHAAHFNFTYKGWYPVISATVDFNDKYMLENKHSFRSNVNIYLPLNLSKNGWNKGITPLLFWGYRNDEEIEFNVSNNSNYVYRKNIDRHYLVASLSAYSSLGVAKSQIFPRWGIGGRLQAGISPNGRDYYGSIYSAYLYGYIPGFKFNDAIKLSASYQYQDYKRYLLNNIISIPRGYTRDIYGEEFFRATIDYGLPIYLGDISLGSIAYLKSLSVVPFADLGLFKVRDHWRNRSSFGSDIVFNGHFLRIGYPISLGLRYARTTSPLDIQSYSSANYSGTNRKNYYSLIMSITFK